MKARALLVLIGMSGFTSCTTSPSDSETKPMGGEVLDAQAIRAARRGPVNFATHVKPVLETKCVTCHNRQILPGHLSLESRAEAVRTGTLGTFIVPGQPGRSLLLANVKSTHQKASLMPPVGVRLTPNEHAILKKWIREGAVWPAGREGVLHYVP